MSSLSNSTDQPDEQEWSNFALPGFENTVDPHQDERVVISEVIPQITTNEQVRRVDQGPKNNHTMEFMWTGTEYDPSTDDSRHIPRPKRRKQTEDIEMRPLTSIWNPDPVWIRTGNAPTLSQLGNVIDENAIQEEANVMESSMSTSSYTPATESINTQGEDEVSIVDEDENAQHPTSESTTTTDGDALKIFETLSAPCDGDHRIGEELEDNEMHLLNECASSYGSINVAGITYLSKHPKPFYPILSRDDVQLLAEVSAKGTGKTTEIINLIIKILSVNPNARIIWVVPRITLASSVIIKVNEALEEWYNDPDSLGMRRLYKLEHYQDAQSEGKKLSDIQLLAVQYDSTWKVWEETGEFGRVRQYDLVILDEICSLLRYCSSAHISSKRSDLLTAFLTLVRSGKKILCSDADLEQKQFTTLLKLLKNDNKNIFLSWNRYKNEKRYAHVYEDSAQLLQLLYWWVEAGLNLIIPTNSRTASEAVYHFIVKNFPELKDQVLLLNQETIKRIDPKIALDCNGWYRRFRFVIYSPTITVGVSIDTKDYWNLIVGFFWHGIITWREVLQMIYRCRYPTMMEIHIWLPRHKKPGEKHTLSESDLVSVISRRFHDLQEKIQSHDSSMDSTTTSTNTTDTTTDSTSNTQSIDMDILESGSRNTLPVNVFPNTGFGRWRHQNRVMKFLTDDYTIIFRMNMEERMESVQDFRRLVIKGLKKYMPNPDEQVIIVPPPDPQERNNSRRRQRGQDESTFSELRREVKNMEVVEIHGADNIEHDKYKSLTGRRRQVEAEDDQLAVKKFQFKTFWRFGPHDNITELFFTTWYNELFTVFCFESWFIKTDMQLREIDKQMLKDKKNEELIHLQFVAQHKKAYVDLLAAYGCTDIDNIWSWTYDRSQINWTQINILLKSFTLKNQGQRYRLPTEISIAPGSNSATFLLEKLMGWIGLELKTKRKEINRVNGRRKFKYLHYIDHTKVVNICRTLLVTRARNDTTSQGKLNAIIDKISRVPNVSMPPNIPDMFVREEDPPQPSTTTIEQNLDFLDDLDDEAFSQLPN
jgi:hypothetical protein